MSALNQTITHPPIAKSVGADRAALTPRQRERKAGRAEPDKLFRTGQVSALLEVSRRQLQYWAQTDLVRPSACTPGGHHRYTFLDLIALGATKQLIDAGISVQRIRGSIRALRAVLPTVDPPLSDLVFVATGDVVVLFKDDQAFRAVSGWEWIFRVSTLQRAVEARVPRRPTPSRSRGRRVPIRSAGAHTG